MYVYVCVRVCARENEAGRQAGGGTKDVLLSQPQGSGDARDEHLDQPALAAC